MFERIEIPLVRRIYPQLLANSIFAVQPMKGPTCLRYYMRWTRLPAGWRVKHRPKVDWRALKLEQQWLAE